MQPGIYSNIPNSEYHGGVGISKSGLDLIRRSPAHYHYARTAVNLNATAPTPAQKIGTAFHMLLLEEPLFEQSYVAPCVIPDGALSTTEDIKAVLKECGEKVSGNKPELIERLKAVRPEAVIADEVKTRYAIQNAGRTILQLEECGQLYAMRAAVMRHPAASALMNAPGISELSAYWNDPETGELCRCRPDFWRLDGIVVDIKTTEDASPDEFARSIANWRYHAQHPYYVDGLTLALQQGGTKILDHDTGAITGDAPAAPRAFVFLVVEKKPPHAVAVYSLDPESLKLGRIENRQDLKRYAECKSANDWPAFSNSIAQISLPDFYLNKNYQLLGATG